MKINDYIEHSFENLWKKKLRTFLTTSGVVIGIAALISMFAFGKGVQKNFTDKFTEMELLRYVTVFPDNKPSRVDESTHTDNEDNFQPTGVLDDAFIEDIEKMTGVELVFPEIRFPALVRFKGEEKYSLIQVISAEVAGSELMKLRAGKSDIFNEPNSLIISDSLLRKMKIKSPESVIGEKIEISTLTFNMNLLGQASIPAMMKEGKLPFAKKGHAFTIAGVSERIGFRGSMPLHSDVYITQDASKGMRKISLTSIQDLFKSTETVQGYPVVSVRLSSPKYVDALKSQIEARGFRTFALIDELKEIKTGFLIMDMFLAGIGMIALVVASLGIVNTMVMSIMERYKEIGIMKAIGATNGDIQKIFFFESGVIGFLGGVLGLILGWIITVIINIIINHFLAGRGVPHTDFFAFPWWLCVGAVLFSILVSLAAGIYPAMRAAHVDPVVALRHD
jgi:putative ABC transport system permease protein